MTAIGEGIFIPAPPENVHDYLLDPANLPTFSASVVRAELQGSGPVGVGSQVRGVSRVLGRSIGWTSEVAESDRPNRLVTRSVEGRISFTDRYTVTPQGSGTALTYRLGGAFGKLADAVVATAYKRQGAPLSPLSPLSSAAKGARRPRGRPEDHVVTQHHTRRFGRKPSRRPNPAPEWENPMSERKRVVEWDDPAPALAAIPSLSGLKYMRAVMDGALPPPPFASLLNIRLVRVDEGTTTWEWEPDESYCSPLGTVHGGFLCTLLESALAAAVHTSLAEGQAYTSLDLAVHYLRPVRMDHGTLTCTGTVVRPGSHAAFAEGTVTDAAGKVLATATGARLVFPAA